ADLKNLSSSPRMFRFIAEHGGPVREPLGKGVARESHGNRACDLCCGIGTQQESQTGRAIDELIARFQELSLQARGQDIEVLEWREDDLLVTPSADLCEELTFELPDLFGRLRKNCRHPDRDE